MAKRKGVNWAAISSLIDVPDKDFSYLTARLRRGVARPAEQAMAADIIEGKLKFPNHRPPGTRRNRDLDILSFVRERIAAGNSKKAAMDDAKQSFKVGRTKIYKILQDMTDLSR